MHMGITLLEEDGGVCFWFAFVCMSKKVLVCFCLHVREGLFLLCFFLHVKEGFGLLFVCMSRIFQKKKHTHCLLLLFLVTLPVQVEITLC